MGFGLIPTVQGSDLDLLGADWLVSAVWMSLGTDRRAQQDDVIPNGSNDKRGWWGDTYRPRQIGSRLWLLSREKQLPETLRRAEEYAQEALQWLIDDKVVSSFHITATWLNKRGFMQLLIIVNKPDGTQHRYEYIWSEHVSTT